MCRCEETKFYALSKAVFCYSLIVVEIYLGWDSQQRKWCRWSRNGCKWLGFILWTGHYKYWTVCDRKCIQVRRCSTISYYQQYESITVWEVGNLIVGHSETKDDIWIREKNLMISLEKLSWPQHKFSRRESYVM